MKHIPSASLLEWLKMEIRIVRILFEIIDKYPQVYSQEKFATLYEEYGKDRVTEIVFELFNLTLYRDTDKPKWWSLFDSDEYVNVIGFTALISDTDLSNKIEAHILNQHRK